MKVFLTFLVDGRRIRIRTVSVTLTNKSRSVRPKSLGILQIPIQNTSCKLSIRDTKKFIFLILMFLKLKLELY